MDKVECVVIGAGVIGLAVARRLAQAGREGDSFWRRPKVSAPLPTSRNSEVIHAGIIIRAGSLDGADVRQRKRAPL